MKKIILCWCLVILAVAGAAAQDFIVRGRIEYEVKVNMKRKLEEMRAEMGKDANIVFGGTIADYSTTYRSLLFSGNQSYYGADRQRDGQIATDGPAVYMDLDKAETVCRRYLFMESMVIQDTLANIRWKIGNEIRTIAGFQCRKAVGKIQDSIYVVAFYCPEIIPQSGPELFTGLPGMILGLAIPRMYTTWFATKIQVAGIDETQLKKPTAKKGKTLSRQELEEYMEKNYKKGGFFGEGGARRLQEQAFGFVLQ
ncbi:MAG: GLPGLI family protein [Candidatus Pseudobacter hemicellulosilyticus]|uniref:GLPGLI family protein n=1 Tax=Candidatus Pseudobacter hemicellulosilyticus TaxID=3121375 RepID=A0AAJ6BDJ4_9BACT|nr:MAG: GLPGLI family protein [Pseudobacter sp.]